MTESHSPAPAADVAAPLSKLQQAFEAAIISPEEFLTRVKADYAKWGAVVKASGASAN